MEHPPCFATQESPCPGFPLTNQEINSLSFSISRRAPGALKSQTARVADPDAEEGAAGSADLADAFTAFDTGRWEVRGKEYNNGFEVNAARKGHGERDADMVELCRAAWYASIDGTKAWGAPPPRPALPCLSVPRARVPLLTRPLRAATRSDAECGCSDCERACGLSGIPTPL